MEELKGWLGLIAVAISVGGVIWGWLTSGGTKALKEVGDLRKSIDDRLAKIDDDILDRFDKLETERNLRAEAITHRFAMFDVQFAKVEEALKHLPDREQSHRMEMAIEKLSGQMSKMDAQLSGRIDALDERLKPVAAISDRLQEFLLEQASK